MLGSLLPLFVSRQGEGVHRLPAATFDMVVFGLQWHACG